MNVNGRFIQPVSRFGNNNKPKNLPVNLNSDLFAQIVKGLQKMNSPEAIEAMQKQNVNPCEVPDVLDGAGMIADALTTIGEGDQFVGGQRLAETLLKQGKKQG